MSEKISEESVPVQELKTPAIVSVRRFLRSVMVVLLAFLCVFVGMLIYQLHTPIDKFAPISPTGKKPPVTAVLVPRHEEQSKVPVAPVTSEPNQEKVETEQTLPTDTVEQPVLNTMPALNSAPVSSEAVEHDLSSAIPTYQLPMLSLADALQLRDHLATGNGCLNDLQKIMKSQIPFPENRDALIDKLMPLCMMHHTFQELEKVFKSDKKQALLTYYRLNNPSWLAYVKAVGTMLVDIRRIHPVKQRAKDVISMAQNALILHDVSQTLTCIRKLPPEIQADFQDFTQLADAYLSAQQAAEELVLSFEKGE